ncbi:MAG: anti-anti-sigma factor [Oceanospirillaceae bacterium]|uniref:STAS domain-containing protein n=1 Tax=unclassified Thalassolituus TaxID=2624967 RepID=UPI000C635F65|nr:MULTISPECIES: STAS domain-containing protein [unclassified Thalassolituus]MAX97822.1 anti-anti-sigma factor [Oceanospirillaceae bacterium]MBS53446.1 anti-anti-sigma factor [Oceanospirillaceae bacterium]|tara:strand:+ start:201 stop:689 length:489 start_codon:yes stop_codon:yes gene_type:complete
MNSGSIQVAFCRGVHVIRLRGDVRLNLSSAFENYLDEILSAGKFDNVVIDLSYAEGVDSTTLGQMAKISIVCREKFGITPTIASPNPGITRILMSMGFDQVFHIMDEPFEDEAEFCEWVAESLDEDTAREQVISAHRVLMNLNDKNKDAFRELVDSLESDGN